MAKALMIPTITGEPVILFNFDSEKLNSLVPTDEGCLLTYENNPIRIAESMFQVMSVIATPLIEDNAISFILDGIKDRKCYGSADYLYDERGSRMNELTVLVSSSWKILSIAVSGKTKVKLGVAWKMTMQQHNDDYDHYETFDHYGTFDIKIGKSQLCIESVIDNMLQIKVRKFFGQHETNMRRSHSGVCYWTMRPDLYMFPTITEYPLTSFRAGIAKEKFSYDSRDSKDNAAQVQYGELVRLELDKVKMKNNPVALYDATAKPELQWVDMKMLGSK